MSYQVAKLVARIAENLPEMSADLMQNWINNPKGLQKVLREALCPPERIITTQNHLIDCDANPFLPEGWKEVEYHKKGGILEWDLTKVKLHLSPNQQNGKTIKGHELREELANEPVLNANVLDYLLAHPELIPEEWKGKCIFFWGTIYRYSGDSLFVRYLCWSGGRWGWDYGWLDGGWDSHSPAACLQVSS